MFEKLVSHYSNVAAMMHDTGIGYHKRNPYGLMVAGGVGGGTLGALLPGTIYGAVSEDKSVWEGIKTVSPYTAALGVGGTTMLKNISNNYARGFNGLGAEKANSMSAYDVGMHGKSLRKGFFSGLNEKF